MKKIFFVSLIIFGCFFAFTELNAQAKKPTIMVIPSSNWCKKNNFKMVYDNQGKKEEVDDQVCIQLVFFLNTRLCGLKMLIIFY